MKISVYSEIKASHKDEGWNRGGIEITYGKNKIKKVSIVNYKFIIGAFEC